MIQYMKRKILGEIRTEMECNGTWDKKLSFKCFADNLFTYHIVSDIGTLLQEVNISANDIFFSEETALSLMQKNGLTFYQHSLHINSDDGGNFEMLDSRTYSLADYLSEN